jgi:hypothetical protein
VLSAWCYGTWLVALRTRHPALSTQHPAGLHARHAVGRFGGKDHRAHDAIVERHGNADRGRGEDRDDERGFIGKRDRDALVLLNAGLGEGTCQNFYPLSKRSIRQAKV